MFSKIPTTVRTSELRKNFSHYIQASAKSPVVISIERGGDTRVLLARDLYNMLVSVYEDAQERKMLEIR